MAAREAQHEV